MTNSLKRCSGLSGVILKLCRLILAALYSFYGFVQCVSLKLLFVPLEMKSSIFSGRDSLSVMQESM